MVDTNHGSDADNYDFVGFATAPSEIEPLIERSNNEDYFIEARSEYEAERNNHD